MQPSRVKTSPEWSFAVRLRQFRGERNLTQEQVAGALGVSKRTYVAWEAGTSSPSVNVVAMMAAAFDITPAWFFETDKEGPMLAGTGARVERLFARLLQIAADLGVSIEPLKLLRFAHHIAEGPPRQDHFALKEAEEMISVFGNSE